MTSDLTYRAKSHSGNEDIAVVWHNLEGQQLPDINWTQVHCVANNNGKVVLVYLDKLGLYHLPGGHIEQDEDIETALRREVAEETGGSVVFWEPIGYQVRTDSKGDITYQLRVYADLVNIQREIIDVDGSSILIRLVPINEMLTQLGWNNPIGERILSLVFDKFKKLS